MVAGLDKIREYLGSFSNNYVIIGGTACELHFTTTEMSYRSTKDVDMMIIVESFNEDFLQALKEFIKQGKYNTAEKDYTKKQYYRFQNPMSKGFPVQLELFTRKPDYILTLGDIPVTKLTAGNNYSGIYAILTDDDYYKFVINNSVLINYLPIPTTEALICMKAYAYLNLKDRKSKGEKIDELDIKKHRNDVFRLAAILEGNKYCIIPDRIKRDLFSFISEIRRQKPDLRNLLKDMRLPQISIGELIGQLEKTFFQDK